MFHLQLQRKCISEVLFGPAVAPLFLKGTVSTSNHTKLEKGPEVGNNGTKDAHDSQTSCLQKSEEPRRGHPPLQPLLSGLRQPTAPAGNGSL